VFDSGSSGSWSKSSILVRKMSVSEIVSKWVLMAMNEVSAIFNKPIVEKTFMILWEGNFTHRGRINAPVVSIVN